MHPSGSGPSAEQRSSSHKIPTEPSVEPYVGRLERFELFSTNQCYYLVGCNKLNTAYRVLKMDRTLVERPPERSSSAESASPHRTAKGKYPAPRGPAHSNEPSKADLADSSHTAKPTLRPLSDFLTEDPNVYSQEEVKEMLDMIHDGNRMTRSDGTPGTLTARSGGGLKPIVKAYGVVGFIRFLDCYYLTLVTRRAKVGTIGGHGIYTIKNVETVPLKPAERSPVPGSDDSADPSSVLLSMWNRGKRSVGLGLTNREIAELRYQGLYQVVDLTKNFYFSYTYDLTRSLQENFLANTMQPFPPPSFKDMYAWNYFLTREFEDCLGSTTSFHWIMPIIHGAFVQRRVNDYGRSLNLVLLARRSRHFAGTRYLKRGVSEEGKVANDVEHEQILHDESLTSPGTFSSYLQVRGSIPIFWTQESSVTMPKPPIELNRVDPTYTSTQAHFADLMKRYSSPILVLDLVKQSEKREREVRVGNEYRHAIDYINNTIDDAHKIRYCALDYSHISKHRHLDVSSALNEVSTWAVNQTGFFCSAPKWKIMEGGTVSPFTEEDGRGATRLAEQLGVPVFPMEQNGVLRTNCIDCLDRTNVAQFSAGVEAIGQQLVTMGIRSRAKLGPSSNIVRVLIDMYVDIGDSIALQYGGSEAHKKVTADRSESIITGQIGKHKEVLTSIRRYYSNAFTDRLKQDAMNLFLGYYLPYRHSVPLWEMETDYYLHNFHVKAGRGKKTSMKALQQSFGIAWNEEEGHMDEAIDLSIPTATHPSSARQGCSDETSYMQQVAESKRVLRVRNRCKVQNYALSSWWKIALQSNLQERMWMKLVGSPSETLLPPRFDRVYQPEKLGQFDRFFSRAWSTPVRRSHAAQHSDGADEGDTADFVRIISCDLRAPNAGNDGFRSDSADEGLPLSQFVEKYGFEARSESSLKLFAMHHNEEQIDMDFNYISHDDSTRANPPEEYARYVAPTNTVAPQSYKSETVEEFKSCLFDYTLRSDDVSGIQKLDKSAHLGETINHGEYCGLSKDASAIEVATAVHEQFNVLESMQSEGQRIVENELVRRGLDKAGVKASVATGWRNFTNAEKQYAEVVDAGIQRCQRSDLTSAESLKIYVHEFDETTNLTTADRIFLEAYTPGAKSERRWPEYSRPHPKSCFVKKASQLGIHITPRSAIASAADTPLFQSELRQDIPAGFEQINEDMFSRSDNKFMVFNRAGVDSWNGTQPITKISHAENILLSTLT